MTRMELEIKNAQDRASVAGILVDNGYRVWTDKVKKGQYQNHHDCSVR